MYISYDQQITSIFNFALDLRVGRGESDDYLLPLLLLPGAIQLAGDDHGLGLDPRVKGGYSLEDPLALVNLQGHLEWTFYGSVIQL